MRKPAVLGALALVLALVLVIACTSSQWQRPDTDAAVLDADMRQCEREANAYARQLASSGVGDKPAVAVTPRGEAGVIRSPHVVPPSDPVAQSDFFNSCMRNKGYQRPASR